MSLVKYWHVAKAEFHHELTHSSNSIVWATILFVIIFVFLQIWKTVYGTKDTIEGFTIAQMIWYLAIAELNTFSNGSHNVEDMEKEIQSGNFSLSLLKPINFIAMWMSKLFGYATFVTLFFGAFAVVLAYLFVGPIPFSFASIPFLLVIFAGALALNFLFVIIYGLSALWLEQTHALAWIHTKFMFILGGMFMPFEMYPAWIQPILHKLPFAFAMYGPAKLFVHFSVAEFFRILLGQALWIVALLGIALMVYKRGVREVSINGG
ncbi:hypothetical protein CMO91_03615 [Candidatus Woesearchaeota archaeon]|nr:hypothetical protein [Candidatus Woesearchaeota archaeon]|tara:strand:+ start:59 stop:850 length:792 start_codon:yes stop_codon:yes gene_type:complete